MKSWIVSKGAIYESLVVCKSKYKILNKISD
jgi:hypothetical protein